MSQIEVYLDTAKRNLLALEQQVGAPSVPGMPQTTNQAIVLVLKGLHEAVNLLTEVVVHREEQIRKAQVIIGDGDEEETEDD